MAPVTPRAGGAECDAALVHPSVAIDLPGRRERPFDLSRVSPDDAAAVAAHDVAARCDGPVVLVAHSGGGIIAPRVAGALGDRVRHMVFVAALIAPHGGMAIDVLFPGRHDEVAKRRPAILRKYENHTFVQKDEDLAFVDGLVPLRDAVQAQSVESMNMLFHPVSWAGVPADMPRTFVRPLRDKHQPPDVQQRLIDACGGVRGDRHRLGTHPCSQRAGRTGPHSRRDRRPLPGLTRHARRATL